MKKKFIDDRETADLSAKLLSRTDHKTKVLWAADCAEHVLPYFEKKNPEDKRPRRAIESARAWIRGETVVRQARNAAFAAHAAARESIQDAPCCAAARSAGHGRSSSPYSRTCSPCGYLRC